MRTYLDFEKPIAELESKVAELKALAAEQGSVSIQEELAKLEAKAREALEETYSELTPWQKTQVARHPERPHFRHYIDGLVEDFTPLAGDRYFGEDQAIIGGIGRLNGRSAMIIGHEKGSDTEGRIKHNFGMARPEGYRKASAADGDGRPLLAPRGEPGRHGRRLSRHRGRGARPGRGHRPLTDTCLCLGVPIVSVIIGEGGSGGAVAIATANRVYMLEHSIYTVASPEAAASILWRDSTRAVDAATNMKITAQDLLRLGIIDGIIPEPIGGAHRDGAGGGARPPAIRIGQALAEFDDHVARGDPQGQAREIPGYRPCKLRILPRKSPLFESHCDVRGPL